MTKNDDVIKTYRLRASSFSEDMAWLEDSDILAPLVPELFGKGRALDACSGTGIVAKKLHEKGWSVVAGDISRDMLEQADDDIEHILADVCDLPFEDNAFDLIVCRQGLQYADLKEALLSLKRVSSNEIRLGHITVSCEDSYSFWNDYFKKASPGRKNVFLPGQIADAAESAGLTVTNQIVLCSPASLSKSVKFLDEEVQQELLSSIITKPKEFLDRNGIVLSGSEITANRRWEFITCKK